MAFEDTATLCLKPLHAIIITAHVRKVVFLSLRKKFGEALKRELDELQKQHKQQKVYGVIETYECDWWNMCKTDKTVTQHLREHFPYKMPLREERLLENIKSGSLFGSVQCDIEAPENLREGFANFPPLRKNINVCRDDIGPFMKNMPTKKEF